MIENQPHQPQVNLPPAVELPPVIPGSPQQPPQPLVNATSEPSGSSSEEVMEFGNAYTSLGLKVC